MNSAYIVSLISIPSAPKTIQFLKQPNPPRKTNTAQTTIHNQASQYPNNFTAAIAPHPAAKICDSCVAAIISEIASL